MDENEKNIERLILNNIPYLAWFKDMEGRYLMVNKEFARAYLLDKEAILGKSDFDLCPPQKAAEFDRTDKEVLLTRKRLFVEQVEELAKGRTLFETYKTPVTDAVGNLIGISGISRDVSESTWMEKVLRNREEQFSALLQNSSDAISIIDEEGRIIFESAEKNKITDFDKGELLGKLFFETVHPDDAAGVMHTFRDALANPLKQIKREYRSLHKNKRWIYVECIFSNQLENPAIRGVIVNSRDITDRKMSELKERVYHDNLIFLSNSALELLGLSSKHQIYHYITEKLGIFLESAVVIFTSLDLEKKVGILESVSGLEAFDADLERIIGKPLLGMSFPLMEGTPDTEHAGTVLVRTDDFLENGIGPIGSNQINLLKELLHIHKVYDISLVRDNISLGYITILTLNKSIIKFKHIIETFVHQVSVVLQRSLLEHELITAKNKAEESDKLKTAFLANMSHEIRTPMNGILGFAEMLNDKTLSTVNRKKYLEIINSNGKMLINLIDDIIDFAKIESGQVNIVQDDISLNNLLNQVHSTFLASRLKRNKSRVRILTRKSFPDEKAFIRTDPIRLRQILMNLVGNAIKFTHKGHVEFGYSLKDSKTLLFFVKDTGIGIPADKLDMIFERFMQADSSPSRRYGGSGLGLAISKGLVELCGGTMWAESTPDVGSNFYFTLPFQPVIRKPEPTREQAPARTTYNWEGRLFLIAEDDKFSYKFLEGFLRQTHAEVIRAADGHEAVELCRNNDHIDLILMDIQMPEMNGLTATEEIKKFNHNVPIIAQTANAISEERQRCIRAGCDDFITKPVNIAELYVKIDKWLSRQPTDPAP